MEYPKECILDTPLIFDTHAHLDDPQFDSVRDELIPLMHKNGVMGVVCCGCDVPSSKFTLEIANKYDFVYAAVGLHPQDIAKGYDEAAIREMASNKKCVAIGEIGLDYYWDKEHKNEQIEIFEKQILLAKELDLPILVHNRDAHDDTLRLLKKHKPKGIVHCFSGSVEMAREILKIGMYIGVGGVVTFKNARRLPEVVEMLPDERMLVETDCPFLAPEPYRGELCHSGLITLTAKKIAEIRNDTLENVLKITSQNAKTLFNL